MLKNISIFIVISSFLVSIAGLSHITDTKNNFTKLKLSSRAILNAPTIIDTVKPLISNEGNIFVTHYDTDIDKNYWSISQDSKGQMLFANSQGISVFNGSTWINFNIEQTPFTIKYLEEQDIVLVGCDNGFGYLKDEGKGKYEYFSLSIPTYNYGEITDIQMSENHIFFYSQQIISVFNRKNLDREYEVVNKQNERLNNGMLIFNDKLFVFKNNDGLYEVNSAGEYKKIKGSNKIKGEELVFNIMLSPDKMIFGTSNDLLYVFDGKTIKNYDSKIQKHVSEMQLVSGVALSDGRFALGTLSRGVVVINDKTHKIENIVDYQNGLPDDEVLAMNKDKYGNIWVSHGLGISQLDFILPIKYYNSYPGIEGILIDVLNFNNTIYVATSEGVYYLSKVESLEDLKYYQDKMAEQKKQQCVPKGKHAVGAKLTKDNKEIVEKTKKDNFFKRWKKKREERKARRKAKKQEKNKSNDLKNKKTKYVKIDDKSGAKVQKLSKAESEELANIMENISNKNKKNTKKTKKDNEKPKKKQLIISYVFKKIKNINTKCKKLVGHKDRILVATNNGLYQIKNNKANKILDDKNINTIVPSLKENIFFLGQNTGFTAIRFNGKKWKEDKKFNRQGIDKPIFDIVEDTSGVLWLASDALVYKVNMNNELSDSIDFLQHIPSSFTIRCLNNEVYFISKHEVYKLNKSKGTIEYSTDLFDNYQNNIDYINSQPNITWVKFKDKWQIIGNHSLQNEQLQMLNLLENISNIKVDKYNNIWVIDRGSNLFRIGSITSSIDYLTDFNVYIQKLKPNRGKSLSGQNFVLPYNITSVELSLNAPYFFRPQETEYQYIVKPVMEHWSNWRKKTEIDLLVNSGKFTIQVRAKNVFGNIRTSPVYYMTVESKLWEENWFYGIIIFLVVSIIFFIEFRRHKRKNRKLQLYNAKLEKEVEKRTTEIKMQSAQIQKKNKEITASINYGSRIQHAILPHREILKDCFSDAFILNKPRNIVSGDFYWWNKIGNRIIVTVGDCTGHGVPGAFLSILGISFLNEIAYEIKELHANTILNLLREKVITTLNQQDYGHRMSDGMDLSLIIYDMTTSELEYAGANNPLYIIRDNKLEEIKADRMPIGWYIDTETPFENQHIKLQEGDYLYLFSDGYMDQFGGEHGKKLLARNFKKLLQKASERESMEEQKEFLDNRFTKWIGDNNQIDDIMVLGLKI